MGNYPGQCHPLHFMGHRTSPAPMSSRLGSTSGSRHQPHCWNQRWQGHGCSDGRCCDSSPLYPYWMVITALLLHFMISLHHYYIIIVH